MRCFWLTGCWTQARSTSRTARRLWRVRSAESGSLNFSIIDEGKVPFLMSLLQMHNVGVSLDLRGSPERTLFHTGFLKGQGVPLHHSAGHLTLNVMDICRKPRHQQAMEGVFMSPAASQPPLMSRRQLRHRVLSHQRLRSRHHRNRRKEKKYRLPSGQRVPAADLYKRTAERSA